MKAELSQRDLSIFEQIKQTDEYGMNSGVPVNLLRHWNIVISEIFFL